jgi:hypothetical protein
LPGFLIVACQRLAHAVRALVGLALSYRVASGDVRREAWALGGRHLGQVLVGARLESRISGLSFRRTALLRAVIRSEALKAGRPL